MEKIKIKKETLQDILKVSEEAYPREVGGLLLGKNQINDFVLIPGEFRPKSVRVKLNQLPIYPHKQGTFHSHPSPHPKPSTADRSFFSQMGRYHMIIAKPYKEDSIKAYNNRGQEINLEVTQGK